MSGPIHKIYRLSDTNIPENLHHLLQDKEALGAVIQASHENHNAFVDSKEEGMVSSLKKWLDHRVTSLSRDENHRNRLRVSEISHFVDYHRKILDDKHITPYVTCFLPEVRGDQVQPVEEEEEEEQKELHLSRMRISSTLLNLTKTTGETLAAAANASKLKDSNN